MSIYEEILAFINAPHSRSFEEMALRVFRHQFACVAPYRDYCVALGIRPETIDSSDEIPAVSTIAFKYAALAASFPPSGRLFMTSGTTVGTNRRGRHFVPVPEIYRASALTHLRRMLFPDIAKMRILALHPGADRMPESSLSQMITWSIEEFGSAASCSVATREKVDSQAAVDFLVRAERDGEPVCLLATTAALAALFDALHAAHRALSLAPRSRLMDTGGAKGQVVPLDAETTVREAGTLLGIEPDYIINEYGMTEMCSQLYDATGLNWPGGHAAGARKKVAPSWVRPFVVDPVSWKRMEDGRTGFLGFLDLANVGSVAAIMTEDLGLVESGVVSLFGRSAASETRGCALGIEQFAAQTMPNV